MFFLSFQAHLVQALSKWAVVDSLESPDKDLRQLHLIQVDMDKLSAVKTA